MTHTIRLHYPPDLYEAPELALLAILEAASQQTLYALFAGHPELAGDQTVETSWLSEPELWAADAICTHISALQHAIERYRQVIETKRCRNFSSGDIE